MNTSSLKDLADRLPLILHTSTLKDVLADRLPFIFAAVFVLAATVVVQRVFYRSPLDSIPIVGTEFGGKKQRLKMFNTDSKPLYLEAYHSNEISRIISPEDVPNIIIPARFLDEIRKLPDETLNFDDAAFHRLAGPYTGLSKPSNSPTHLMVKQSLASFLSGLNALLAQETVRTIREEMGPLDGWTEINVHNFILRVVAIVSGRMFIGPEICRDPRYVEAAIMYTVEVMQVRDVVLAMPSWQRPFRARFLPEVVTLRRREDEFCELVVPIIEARRKAKASDPNYVAPEDALTWFEDVLARHNETRSARELAFLQLELTFAAIHTTTMTLMNIIFDLVANPSIIPELQAEAAEVLASSDGVFTPQALQSLKKMDSVMKESQRLHPSSYSNVARMVLRPFTLSNGQPIPAGAIIQVASAAIMNDDAVFPDADRFDGLRFLRLRETSTGLISAQNQFVSVSKNHMGFGYGRHACPGRFFVANEIKMIMARLLLNYEVKMPNGSTERYPNVSMPGGDTPDPTRTLLFREKN